MELKVRNLNDNDWDTLTQWWIDWGFGSAVERSFLPSTGYIAEKNTIPIFSFFLYETNSGVAWLAWHLSNKKYTNQEDRNLAIQLIIKKAEKDWKQKGGKFLFFAGDNKVFNNKIINLGFNEGDSNYDHLIKAI